MITVLFLLNLQLTFLLWHYGAVGNATGKFKERNGVAQWLFTGWRRCCPSPNPCKRGQIWFPEMCTVSHMSFSSYSSFFILVDKSYEKRKILHNSLFVFLLFFIFILPVLPCKRKTLYRKSLNLFLFLVTSSAKMKNGK